MSDGPLVCVLRCGRRCADVLVGVFVDCTHTNGAVQTLFVSREGSSPLNPLQELMGVGLPLIKNIGDVCTEKKKERTQKEENRQRFIKESR